MAPELPPPVQMEIVAPDRVHAGETVPVAVVLRVPAGWHVYWENPGQSGLPTDVRLATEAAPDARKPRKARKPPASTIRGPAWPTPTRFEADSLVNYGYADAAAFVFDVTPTGAGTLTLHAEGSWLLCRDICVTGNGEKRDSIELTGGKTTPEPALAGWLARLPRPFAESGGTVTLAGGELRITLPAGPPVDVFPSSAGLVCSFASC